LHWAYRLAEQAFTDVLRRFQNPPALERVRVCSNWHRDELECIADFSNGYHVAWRIPPERRHDFRGIWAGGYEQECLRLYSRLYEDRFAGREFEALEMHYLACVRNLPPGAEETRWAREELETRRGHVRRHHRQAARAVEWQTSYAIESAEVLPPSSDELVSIMRDAQQRMEHNLFRAMQQPEWIGPFPFGDVGNEAAQKKGLALLKEWLSPAQREQYEKHKHFEVIGGATGKRYRIKHGRQQNIEELDKNGNPKCGWCFLPEGGLVAGDVMLAQKIALETNEKAALKIANQFPVAGGSVRFGTRVLDMRPGAVTWMGI